MSSSSVHIVAPASSFSPVNPNSSPGNSYMVNSKIMVVAVAVLFGVVLFVFCIHIYAKWFWRNHHAASIVNVQAGSNGARSLSWSRRRFRGQLNFLMVGENNGGNNNHRSLAQVPRRFLDGFGLDKAVVELLPTFVYRATEMKGAALECAVCLEEFEEKETGRLLPRCNHSFHIDCIDMWFSSHSSCPLCRTSVKLPDKKPAVPDESWQLMELSNQAGPAASSPHQQVLLLESGNTLISSTQASQAAAGSSLNTSVSSSGPPGAGAAVAGVSAHQGSTQQEYVDSRGPGSEEPHHQEQNQALTTTTSLPPEKGHPRSESNLSLSGPGANIPPNVLFWGTQTHDLNAAAQSRPATITTTKMAADLDLQQEQRRRHQGPKFARSISAGGQASSAVAVEINGSTSRSPVAVAEAEGSSRSHMARLVSLKRLLNKGRPIALSTEPQNSSQTDLEQGASSSASSSMPHQSTSTIPDTSTVSSIMTFFLSP